MKHFLLLTPKPPLLANSVTLDEIVKRVRPNSRGEGLSGLSLLLFPGSIGFALQYTHQLSKLCPFIAVRFPPCDRVC